MADRDRSHVNDGYQVDNDELNPTAVAKGAPSSNNWNVHASDDCPPDYDESVSDNSSRSSRSSGEASVMSNMDIANPSVSSDTHTHTLFPGNRRCSLGSSGEASGISAIANPSVLSADGTISDNKRLRGLTILPPVTTIPEPVSNSTRDGPHTSFKGDDGYRRQPLPRPPNNDHQDFPEADCEPPSDARQPYPFCRTVALPDGPVILEIRGRPPREPNPRADENRSGEDIETYPARYPETTTEQRSPGVSGKTVRCVGQRCCAVIFVLAAVIVVALTMAFILYNPLLTTFFAKATLQMRVKEPFQPELLNLSSPLAMNYTTRLCEGMRVSLNNRSQVDKVPDCAVISFSNGSIVVEMKLDLHLTIKVSQTEFEQDVLMKSGHRTGGVFFFADIPVYPDSVTIISFSVSVLDESPASSTTTPATVPDPEFSCSVGDELYKPYPYTYPTNCGHYQRCDNGHSIQQYCEAGLEFDYNPDSRLGPCRHPSNTTYCGRKRLQKTVTSPPTATAVTSEVTVTSSTTANPCSSLHPLILNNSPSLYSCQDSGPQSFRPHEDTYPGNCGTFQWCQYGQLLNITQCAKGSSFVFGGSQTKACYPENDPETFCEQMKLAETCR